MRKSLLVSMLCAAVSAAAFAAGTPQTGAGTAETVGGFALKVAAAYGADARDQSAAAAALQALGVSLGPDLGARLTEGQAAGILADLGLKVAPPAAPGNTVSVGMADRLATRVGLTCAKGSNPPPGGMPTQCLHSKNRPACEECCAQATHCGSQDHGGGKGDDHGHGDDHHGGFGCDVCKDFCKANVPPPPSPGKP